MMVGIDRADVEELIQMAISEDIGSGDVTSLAIFSDTHMSRAAILSKGSGIFCGGDIIRHVYGIVEQRVIVNQIIQDGVMIHPGDVIAELEGPTTGILAGERITLNFLQRLCGIATKTRRLVALASGTDIMILDTRKTVPGFRKLDKYAVRCGSGRNHRMGLYDMVMIKDNHITAAGGISRAVAMVRGVYGSRFTIEVEASNPNEAKEAAECGVDIIMLDNMDSSAIRDSIEVIKQRAKIEVSGNMDETRLLELINLEIDYVSIGSLTHSVDAFDLSMKFE